MERREVPRLFFTKEEQKTILEAIADAESKTSAEIVVRLERNCPGNPLEHCRDLLQTLGITEAPSRAGVIILISLEDHKVAIFGDSAVHPVVGEERWKTICAQLVAGFKKEMPCEALCKAICSIGNLLSVSLPYKEGDVNELPNELSVGRD
jgi:uncharacterized membrane protein